MLKNGDMTGELSPCLFERG